MSQPRWAQRTPPTKQIPAQFNPQTTVVTGQTSSAMEIEIEVEGGLATGPIVAEDHASPVSAPPSEPYDQRPFSESLTVMDRTLIVLDYDDTLFPTTQFCEDGYTTSLMCEGAQLTAQCKQQVYGVESEAVRLVSMCRGFGTCVLLTNAEWRWLEQSSHHYMPRLKKQLQDDEIAIAFGREWQQQYPSEPGMWKQMSFRSELTKMRQRIGPSATIRLVSIGDSTFERTAAEMAGKLDGNVEVKTIKLVDLPSPGMLRQQIALLCLALKEILDRDGALSIDMELRFNDSSAEEDQGTPPQKCD